jgi:hypothetical protein
LKHSGTYMQQKSFFFVFWLQIFVAENWVPNWFNIVLGSVKQIDLPCIADAEQCQRDLFNRP